MPTWTEFLWFHKDVFEEKSQSVQCCRDIVLKKGKRCSNVLNYDHFFLEYFINLIHIKQKDEFHVCWIHTPISLLAMYYSKHHAAKRSIWNLAQTPVWKPNSKFHLSGAWCLLLIPRHQKFERVFKIVSEFSNFEWVFVCVSQTPWFFQTPRIFSGIWLKLWNFENLA